MSAKEWSKLVLPEGPRCVCGHLKRHHFWGRSWCRSCGYDMCREFAEGGPTGDEEPKQVGAS